jgi:hypothetical protein
MILLSSALIIFGVLELLNVLLLYLAPGLRKGNSLGFFNAYEKSTQDPEIFALTLTNYLVRFQA